MDRPTHLKRWFGESAGSGGCPPVALEFTQLHACSFDSVPSGWHALVSWGLPSKSRAGTTWQKRFFFLFVCFLLQSAHTVP